MSCVDRPIDCSY